MKYDLAIDTKNEEDLYTCAKSGKKIMKSDPVCPTPNTYCKFRVACIIFDLDKKNLKMKKIDKF